MTPLRPDALAPLVSVLLRLLKTALALGEDRVVDATALAGRVGAVVRRWEEALPDLVVPADPQPPPLGLLRARLGLTPVEADALLLALSTRVEPGLWPVWQALLPPGVRLGPEGPSMGQALDLLVGDPVARLDAVGRLEADRPLRRWALLEGDGRGELRPTSRLLRFLLGADEVDASLQPRVTLAPRPDLATLGDARLDADVARLAAALRDAGERGVVVVQGDDAADRRIAAEVLCGRLPRRALHVDLWSAAAGGIVTAAALPPILREAALLDAPLILDAACPEAEVDALRGVLAALLHGAPVPVVVLNHHLRLAELALHRPQLFVLEVPHPSLRLQGELWKTHLAQHGPVDAEVNLDALAERFDMSAGQIRTASRLARAHADTRAPGGPITVPDLHRGSVEVFTHRLGGLAWRIPPSRLGWDDLVIAPEVRRQLQMMTAYMRHRRLVYEGWGMDRYLSGGKGVKALFYGPPGTGKTLGAAVMARELGLDLYQVDLSQIVSKWVGETEKNLDRVLTAAEDSQVILLFDEADSLFGGRGEVKSATDRYANMEVNYLLQRFDHFDGAVVLTSNLVESVDKAFARRLHFLVEFPFPDEVQRLELWRRMLTGGELPLGPDVDIEELARRFELAGGNIRNAVLTAAFLAAERGESVRYLHILQALAWEMQKQGMVPSRTAFGEHWSRLV